MNKEDEPSKDDKIIICFTGMPGAGKSTAANAAKEIGFEVMNMGDGVREETKKRGLSLSDKNVGNVMMDIRRLHGMGAVAKISLPKIVSTKNQLIAMDGVRNMEEVHIFRENRSVKIIAIHASPEIRFKHLRNRSRADVPESWNRFVIRDEREISVGIGSVIALADEIVINNNISIDILKDKTLKILRKWITRVED
jgi:dephospho-CoA kinase